jgi:CelD/BcsL family acetyltransferase involved in cellulose biosynthesis
MKTRLVRVKDISPDDEHAWRRLGERAVEPNPFAEPDFFILSTRYFEGYRDATVVIAQEGTEFLGVVPFAGIDTPRLPPRRVASTRANPMQITGLHTPLVDRTDPHRVVDALLDALSRAARSEGWPGILLLDEIGSDGPVAASLLKVCEERRYPVYVKDSWDRGTVSRAGQWANPVDGKRRREIRRRQRLLTEEAGAEVVLVDRSLAPGACDDFMAMEIAGWKGREGGHAFARYPNMAEWFREWHRCLVAGGRATLLSLEAGSHPVAMAYVVRAGDGLFCFRIAFDEAYAKYGPGPMLLSSALTYLRDTTDAAWFDSMTSKDNTFFLGLLPERRRLSRLFIGTGGTLDRALVSALPAMAKLSAASHQMRHRLVRNPRTRERSRGNGA